MNYQFIYPSIKLNRQTEILKETTYITEFSFPTCFYLYNTQSYVRINMVVLGFGISIGWREDQDAYAARKNGEYR